jgi:hypothetical protein
MLWLFFLFMWIWIFISIVGDLFRDHEASGVTKVVWLLVLVLLPVFGSLVYLLVRGKGMAERSMKQSQRAQAAFDDYVRQAAGTSPSPVDELAKLSQLRASGAISDDEFASMKAKIVA